MRLALPGMKTTANVLDQMPPTTESVQGYNVLRDHFPPGQLGPLYILLQTAPGQASQTDTLQKVAELGGRLSQISGVAAADYPGGAGATVQLTRGAAAPRCRQSPHSCGSDRGDCADHGPVP